jgi:hypothetical protein
LIVLAGLALAGCKPSHQSLSRGDAAAVVLARPQQAASPGVTTLDEKEPNDPLAGPNYVPFTSGALVMRGTLTGVDEDTFDLQIPGAVPAAGGDAASAPADGGVPRITHRLAIDVTPGDGLASELAVRAESGALLASCRPRGPGQRYGLPNLGVFAGERLVVQLTAANGRPKTSELPYTLGLRLLPLEGGEEREPNNAAAQATPLPPAHAAPEAAGYLGTSKDEDWFRVPLGAVAEGTVLAVELDPPGELAASLTVLDASERKVATASARRGQRVTLRNLAASALARPAGARSADGGAVEPFFYAVVRAEGAGFDLEHRYLLRVRADAGSDVDEREPNDDPTRAGSLVAGAATGYLPPGDVDVFRVDAPAGAMVTADVVPPQRLDVVLELLARADGPWLRADAGRRGVPEHLEAVAAGGQVLVRISPKKGDGVADDSYRLNVRVGPPGADSGRPPAGPAR